MVQKVKITKQKLSQYRQSDCLQWSDKTFCLFKKVIFTVKEIQIILTFEVVEKNEHDLVELIIPIN